MKKSTKGALAASAAALLLLGGLGTHATWTDGKVADGTDMATGQLQITDWVCGGWKLDGVAFVPGTDKLVPGNVLQRVCTFKVAVEGAGLRATLDVDVPKVVDATTSNPIDTILDASAVFTSGGSTLSPGAEVTNGQAVTATLSVGFDSVSGLTGQNLTATLDDVTVTATQA